MQISVDANDIIENLTQEVSKYIRENAILKAQIKVMQEQLELHQEESETVEV